MITVSFVIRSSRHSSPILELDLFRVRSFAVSSIAMVLFSSAFAGSLLSVLIWAQTAWGWSALHTGLAFAPGPLMVPLFSIGAGKLAGRVSPGMLATLGCLSFAGGMLVYATRVQLQPNYLGAMLPGALLVGIGVGLTLPTLTATAASSLPAQRFATGSAVITMTRQVGFTLGVAILVAVLGRPHTAATRLDAYRHGWEVIGAIAFVAACAASLLVRRTTVSAAVLAKSS